MPPTFGSWLAASMQQRGFSPAAFARTLGVADAQVSRWRRGQVVPSVQSLQRIADVLGVPRASLDALAGYPVAEGDTAPNPDLEAASARLRDVLETRVPRPLWPAYVESCAALAETLADSLDSMLARSGGEGAAHSIGFRAGH